MVLVTFYSFHVFSLYSVFLNGFIERKKRDLGATMYTNSMTYDKAKGVCMCVCTYIAHKDFFL